VCKGLDHTRPHPSRSGLPVPLPVPCVCDALHSVGVLTVGADPSGWERGRHSCRTVQKFGAPIRGPAAEKLRAMVRPSSLQSTPQIAGREGGSSCCVASLCVVRPSSPPAAGSGAIQVRAVTESWCKGDARSYFHFMGLCPQFEVRLPPPFRRVRAVRQ
jgi:hypothetical protein